MKNPRNLILTFALGALALFGSTPAFGQKRAHQKRVHHARPATVSDDEASAEVRMESGQVRMKLADGTFIVADEASESEQGIWYRQGGMNHLISRDRVKKIDRGASTPKSEPQVAKVVAVNEAEEGSESSTASTDQPVWIYLVGGARVEADNVIESPAGAWYRRGPLSVFVEKSRIDHIEREVETLAESNSSSKKARGWTTGNLKIDGYIKQSGAKYGVDPYLIFCVMEQESHFNSRALSPKGARGLMQLMPGTSAMLGVRRPSDPAQNIAGGTRFLKQLLQRFDGRIDLVLASYNAGEGAVMKFGRRVPPYQETRNYVKRISFRYRQIKPVAPAKGNAPTKNEVATVKAAL
jgi:hypothetical protein